MRASRISATCVMDRVTTEATLPQPSAERQPHTPHASQSRAREAGRSQAAGSRGSRRGGSISGRPGGSVGSNDDGSIGLKSHKSGIVMSSRTHSAVLGDGLVVSNSQMRGRELVKAVCAARSLNPLLALRFASHPGLARKLFDRYLTHKPIGGDDDELLASD